MPDLAVRQNRFQPKAQIACVAIAQNIHAAGIGGQIATDPATALRGQRQRKQPPDAFGGGAHVMQNRPGLDNHDVVLHAHIANCVHALDRKSVV